MKRYALAILTSFGPVAVSLVVNACEVNETSIAGPDAAAPLAVVESGVPGVLDERAPSPCANAGTPPSTLECTGLYADFASKTLAEGVHPYMPGATLWSDGAGKSRWIMLPPGSVIDATNPREWVFPIGTKAWKEFWVNGRRIETRLFQKVSRAYWVNATYAWNEDETRAVISFGGDVPVDGDGGTWHIPSNEDCNQCHRGRSDRLLGFEAVGLGLAGATGLTLEQLALAHLITPPPASVHLAIGDDGADLASLAAPALAWLHMNCGVTCHNGNENALGFGAGMLLRLDPAELDGRRVSPDWDPLRTTVRTNAVSGAVQGKPRIVPGDPASSVLAQLIATRGSGQMPPIASKLVDVASVAVIESWIARMPLGDAGSIADSGATDGGPHDDGGDRDAGDDGGLDAGNADAADAADGANDGPSDATEAGGDASEDANDDADALSEAKGGGSE